MLLLSTHNAQSEINVKNASYYRIEIDGRIGNAFQLRRVYNSRSLHIGIFGFGWCSDLEKKLDLESEMKMILRDCLMEGAVSYLSKDGKIFVNSESGEAILREQDFDVRLFPDGSSQKFDRMGRLVSLVSSSGQVVSIAYLDSKIFMRISDESPLEMNLKDGKVETAQIGRRILAQYSYAEDDLITVTETKDPIQYKYDRYHNLQKVVLGKRVLEEIEYDTASDRVRRITREDCQEQVNVRELANADYNTELSKVCGGRRSQQVRFQFLHTKIKGAIFLNKILVTEGAETKELQTSPLQIMKRRIP